MNAKSNDFLLVIDEVAGKDNGGDRTNGEVQSAIRDKRLLIPINKNIAFKNPSIIGSENTIDKRLPVTREKRALATTDKNITDKGPLAIENKELPTIIDGDIADKDLSAIRDEKLLVIGDKRPPTIRDKELLTIVDRRPSAITDKRLPATGDK